MLRLPKPVLAHILSRAPTPSASIHRLLSAAAPSTSPNPTFAVDEYLVATCGLTPAQALKASAKLAHLKSPSNPDAVLAFLRGHGLSGADVAALVAKDPKFLCANVDKILAPNVADLTGLGLSRPEIARLILHCHVPFRGRSIVPKLQYYLPILGSWDNFFLLLKRNPYALSSDVEAVIKRNVTLLRECGLGDGDIAKLCVRRPRLLNTNAEGVQATVARAEGLGVPRGSGMFGLMLLAVADLSEENVAARVDNLRKMFRWSEAEAAIAVSKAPTMLGKSKDNLQHVAEFLISEVGLEPEYIAHRPIMINRSLKGCLKPRHYVVKFLEANGLFERGPSYSYVFKMTDKLFTERFLLPHKEAAPRLAQDYAAACRGEVPARFASELHPTNFHTTLCQSA